jgi:hypothetical protein
MVWSASDQDVVDGGPHLAHRADATGRVSTASPGLGMAHNAKGFGMTDRVRGLPWRG